MTDIDSSPAAAAAVPAEPARTAVGTTIARNSFWLLLDSVYGMAAAFYCSIAVARGLGPDRMGDYNYVIWFASVLRLVTEMAIPMTFRKFAAELMGREDYPMLKALVRYSMRVQVVLAVVGVSIGLVIALAVVGQGRRFFVTLAVVSVVPALLLSIPTGALQATEKLRHFVLGSLIGVTVNLVGITLSVVFHWGLMGVMVSFVSARFVDCAFRYAFFLRIYSKLPGTAAPALDPALRKRLFGFALRQLPQIVFQILLWERMEVFFLKKLAATRDIAFFSISVTLIQYVMQLPASLAGSAGTTLMVQQGRAPGEVARIATTAIWFTMLLAAPALFGVASVADPLLRVLYGARYLDAIPVLTVLGLVTVTMALQLPLGPFLLATEQQNFIIFWGSVQVVVSVASCLLLVPRLGATGAALSRGICHFVGVTGFLAFIVWRFKVPMPVGRMIKLLVACTAMFVAVRLVQRPLPALAGLVVGIPVGAAIFVVATRLLGFLDSADRGRLQRLGRMLPARARGAYSTLVDFLARAVPDMPRPISG